MVVPQSQYEDLYPTFVTWRLVQDIQKKLGRMENWGEGPSAEAVRAGPLPSKGQKGARKP